MQHKIYVFRTHKINLANLFLSMVYHNNKNLAFEPCYYNITNGKFFTVSIGSFAEKCQNLTQTSFRNINWTEHVDKLYPFIEQAEQLNRSLVFGCHSDEQIDFLKEHFGDDVYTVGIDYDQAMYPTLLNDAVEYHLYLLDSNQIESNEHDRELSQLAFRERVDAYKNSFEQINLFPHKSFAERDYNINISDFTDQALMLEHLTNIFGPISDNTTVDYYQQWLSGFTAK
jgi:hypothetical protein